MDAPRSQPVRSARQVCKTKTCACRISDGGRLFCFFPSLLLAACSLAGPGPRASHSLLFFLLPWCLIPARIVSETVRSLRKNADHAVARFFEASGRQSVLLTLAALDPQRPVMLGNDLQRSRSGLASNATGALAGRPTVQRAEPPLNNSPALAAAHARRASSLPACPPTRRLPAAQSPRPDPNIACAQLSSPVLESANLPL